ncbi:hypothetical protein QEH68_01355 [Paenarthrobacter sp. OM7]|uniref:Uncharacterized protein n=1 Tax=Paenarthrobacter sp. AMU7 TaxID=3162492 RepID=A0AB39YTS0_9MICC|nr:hypothetical protein [Paenarthrobacter sp. OM7]WGM20865.1 hypothetical protein QEH68_01355 [Paenarthrobacter sp. OM7]
MPNIKPYRLHRTWHLAQMLNFLQANGEVEWEYDYDDENSRAIFHIQEPSSLRKSLQTKPAEAVAQRLANKLRIVWAPVPHYGGEQQWQDTVERIDAMKAGQSPKPWE